MVINILIRSIIHDNMIRCERSYIFLTARYQQLENIPFTSLFAINQSTTAS